MEDARRELRDQMEMEKELREKLIPLEQILRTEDVSSNPFLFDVLEINMAYSAGGQLCKAK